MLISYHLGATSIILRVKIRNSSVSTGAGLTGLTSASSGLIISTIADNESTATAYTAAGSTIETITTLGTFATPTATKCRFKEVDSTNHKGIYEIQIDNARFAVSNAKSLLVSISGATNAAECDAVIPLTTVDPYDTKFGITANVPADAKAINGVATTSVTTINANVGTTQPTNFTGTGASALVKGDAVDIGGTAQTGRDIGASVLVSSGTGTGQISLSSGTVTVGTNNDKTGYGLSSSERSTLAGAILDLADAIETGITPRQAIRGLVACIFGEIASADTNPEVFKNPAGDTTRVTVANDTSGNRSGVTLNL